MSRVTVVVASESAEVDLLVPGIEKGVAARPDMRLISARQIIESHPEERAEEIANLIKSIPSTTPCALVLVCKPSEGTEGARRYLTVRADLVVVEVTIGRRDFWIGFLDPQLDVLLSALQDLVDRMGTPAAPRMSQVRLDAEKKPAADTAIVATQPTERSTPSRFAWWRRKRPPEPPPAEVAAAPVQEPQPQPEERVEPPPEPPAVDADTEQERVANLPARIPDLGSVPLTPLLQAAVDWLHALLREAIDAVSEVHGDAHGVSLTRGSLLELLAARRKRSNEEIDSALDKARDAADPRSEPLAAAASLFQLNALEFRFFVLALAPELNVLYQRCIGFLLDDMSRRTGTFTLYCSLLGPSPNVRRSLAFSSSLPRWLVFETAVNAGDEPLRVDPYLVQWLLGERNALALDPRVRRVLRPTVWLGRKVLPRDKERETADHLVGRLILPAGPQWLLLPGEDSAGWRAVLELGGQLRSRPLIRVDVATWPSIDLLELEDIASRIGRMQRLTGDVLAIDATSLATVDRDRVERFLSASRRTGCRGAIICNDAADVVHQLRTSRFTIEKSDPISRAARVAAFREAARRSGAVLSEEDAADFANRYPLALDELEAAMNLAARQVPKKGDVDASARFAAACRSLAAEGLSQLAEHIEPAFELKDVVLPPDRKRQLEEIVHHVQLAPKVFDGWNFGKQLPYGRGVSALFFGPSGTGKTMAAMGVARKLRIPLLRLDLSRVVSKYIGDTEKNIDRIFDDAKRSGAAILIDEADALLGKRSEVKDAHDRYANIEVAYLLQRMEAYEGLAILTTNMRQSLDPAFLRRLRFIVEFPHPDQTARESIWRFCLPPGSHELDNAAFRLLARRIDLSGGHIRQITLHAAFAAAAAGRCITLVDIEQAARAEFAKLGMPPVQLVVNPNRSAA